MAVQSSSSRGLFIAQFTLRISVIALTICSIIITVTNRQTLDEYGFIEEYDYRGSPSMKFGVGANAVVGSLCFGSLILVCTLKGSKSDPQSYLQLFLHDMAMAIVSIAGCAAVTGELYLAKYGQGISFLKIWSPYCSFVGKFCQRMFIPLLLSYLTFLCMFILALMAAHKLKVTVQS